MTKGNNNKGFDFDAIGKKTPYTVPTDAFDEMEQVIARQVGITPSADNENEMSSVKRKPSAGRLRIVWGTAIGIAASLLLVFTLHIGLKPEPAIAMDDVEQAFSQLDDADQQYLASVYQDDIFDYE